MVGETKKLQTFNNAISLWHHEQVCFIMLRLERYFYHHRVWWWETYLSKGGLVKLIDKLIGLWSLNRQAKIFLRIKTFSRHFFWEEPSKYYIVEFTAIFVGLLLSWSRRYSMKWNSNFDCIFSKNSWPLYSNFSNTINLCPNTWFIKNSKCQKLYFEKGDVKKHKFPYYY